jgi:hypothetical protein
MQNTPPKTPAQRGLRTLAQAVVGSLIGLVAAVWNVPGVPQAVTAYAQQHFVPLFLTFIGLVGVPSALVAYAQNRLETKK